MPKLEETVRRARPYREKLEKGELEPRPFHPVAPLAPTPPLEPVQKLNSTLCCPLPGIAVSPDSLVQYYRQGIPQMRILAPKLLTS